MGIIKEMSYFLNFSPKREQFLKDVKKFFLKKQLYGLFFYGWGSTASRLELLQEGSLLFTAKFPEMHGTHKNLIDVCLSQWVARIDELVVFESLLL